MGGGGSDGKGTHWRVASSPALLAVAVIYRGRLATAYGGSVTLKEGDGEKEELAAGTNWLKCGGQGRGQQIETEMKRGRAAGWFVAEGAGSIPLACQNNDSLDCGGGRFIKFVIHENL